ncbi:MAG: hypothetical protein L6302_04160, partial [Desulfobacteraceae bacterium]|nr:hypothetical protein [Desulfobacteraceae bacterium]
GLAKSLDISIGMPTLFANLAASRSRHISSQKIAQLRLYFFIHIQVHKRIHLGSEITAIPGKRN